MVRTERLLLVVRAADRPVGEQAATVADPTTSGSTFRAGLRPAGGTATTPSHFWASWLMLVEERDRLVAEFTRVAGEQPILPVGGTVNRNARYWLFDGNPGQWAAPQVLTSLGLELMPVGA